MSDLGIEEHRKEKREKLSKVRGKGSKATIFDHVVNKCVITYVLLFIQAVIIILGYVKIEIGNVEKVINIVLQMIAVFNLALSYQNPGYRISWLVLIMILPFFGSLSYLIFGDNKIRKQIAKKLKDAEGNITDVTCDDTDIIAKQDDNIRDTISYLSNYADFPAFENTEAEYIPLGDDIFEKLMDDIRSAKKSIYLEFFIIETGIMWDIIKEELIKKAKTGLDIKMIYDDVGTTVHMPEREINSLKDAGCKIVKFNPVLPRLSLIYNSRDHRKIALIDNNIGYMCGINIGDEYINVYKRAGLWKDVGIRIKGEGTLGMTRIFMKMWATITGEKVDINEHIPDISHATDGIVQPLAEVPSDREMVMKNVFLSLIWSAKEKIEITTPYLILDNEMTEALIVAAKKGVDVRVVVPGIPDKPVVYEITKLSFDRLIEGGVKIYIYNPGFIHAKVLLFDRNVSIVGSMNQDYRSIYLQFESATLTTSKNVADGISKDLDEIYEFSDLAKHSTKKRGFFKTIRDGVLKLMAPLF